MIPQEQKLLSMLSNNDVTFFIPPYQRNYEWNEEQCKVLLDDIVKTYESNRKGTKAEHFFGSITFFQTEAAFGQPNKLVLIDGQQRVTTTMLFLVALRDILKDENIVAYIDKKYLRNENVADDTEYKIKLKQVETDWEAYKNIILGDELTEKEKNSAVYRNYKYFTSRFGELQNEGYDLGSLIENGLDKFSVITIQLQPDKNPWENPQEIFESMNSLGKPLSLADLVRNYLLLGLDADTQSFLYIQYWLHIEKAIPGKVSMFIRDYMQAHETHPYLRATESNYKELYRLFKKIFENSNAKELLKDLSESATIYSYITEDVSTGNKNIDSVIRDLNTLNVSTAYSFFLALLKEWKQNNFTDKDIVDILDVFKIYCMRRRIIGLSGAENKNFPLLAGKINDLKKTTDKRKTMFEILAKQESNLRLPNDIEVSRFMETMNFYNFKYCKFYLSLVEESITRSRPDQSDEKLQIEHIMPKTLNDAWRDYLGADCEAMHQELVNTIGNLTLIRHNQELGQKLFNEKKETYENNAGLQIAKTEIIDKAVWNGDTIQSRTRWLIKYLLDNVLAIPESMRITNNFNQKEGRGLSFQELQLIGLDINFIDDPTIVARVVSDHEVEFEGKRWRLSPLTREIQTRRGKLNASGGYSGAQWWEFDGIRLSDVI